MEQNKCSNIQMNQIAGNFQGLCKEFSHILLVFMDVVDIENSVKYPKEKGKIEKRTFELV